MFIVESTIPFNSAHFKHGSYLNFWEFNNKHKFIARKIISDMFIYKDSPFGTFDYYKFLMNNKNQRGFTIFSVELWFVFFWNSIQFDWIRTSKKEVGCPAFSKSSFKLRYFIRQTRRNHGKTQRWRRILG